MSKKQFKMLVGSSNKNKTSDRDRESSDAKQQWRSKPKEKARSHGKTFLYTNDGNQEGANDKTHRRGSSSDAKVSKDQSEQLNCMFLDDIDKLERMICKLDFREKCVATEWVIKLKQSNTTMDEMRVRNAITSYLLKCCNQNVFRTTPFNQPPPAESVTTISSAATMSDRACITPNEKGKKRYISQLYNEVCDQGKFLNELPVPRDGAFFILHLKGPTLKPK